MRSRLLLGLTATTALTAPAAAESWYEVGTGDLEIAFADTDSISRSGEVLQMNVFQSFEYGQGDNSNVLYARQRLEIDCSNRQIRELSIDTFDNLHAPLGPLATEGNWFAIQANTFGEGYRQIACDSLRPGTPYPDPFIAGDDYWDYMYYYYGP